MTDMERIDAAIAEITDPRTKGMLAFEETILEALRFQKAALGEPSDEVLQAGKYYFDQARDCCGFKAMIAELAKQVKENDDGG